MSTTFQVLPSLSRIPNCSEVLSLAQKQLNVFLLDYGINKQVGLKVESRKTNTHEMVKFSQEDLIVTKEDEYNWFYIPNLPGGTDCYYHKNLPIDHEAWKDEITTNPNATRYQGMIKRNLEIGHIWIFRRSAGQPSTIALCYGLLAYSLAKITEGIIYSDDGAWDYEKFPAKPDDFINWYFRPEYAIKQDDKEFSQKAIILIKHELDIIS